MLVRLGFGSMTAMAAGAIPSSKGEVRLFYSVEHVSIHFNVSRGLWLTDTPKGC
jgi:hypothetical protein